MNNCHVINKHQQGVLTCYMVVWSSQCSMQSQKSHKIAPTRYQKDFAVPGVVAAIKHLVDAINVFMFATAPTPQLHS